MTQLLDIFIAIKISIIYFLPASVLTVNALKWKDTMTGTITICKLWKIK